MKLIKWTAPLLALGIVSTPGLAEDATQQVEQEEASIYFVNQRGIRNWRAEDRETLYIQDRKRDWYKATLMYPSHELPFAWAIGFDTGGVNRLDNFSSVVVEGHKIPIKSLVAVDGPPSREDA